MPADLDPGRAGRVTRRALVAGSALGAAALLSGCVPLGGGTETEPESEPVLPWRTVVATTPILADIVRSVGGSRVAVRTMMPPSADPHRFVPGPSAGDAFVDADLIVRHGMGLEAGLDGLLALAGDVPVITATELIPPEMLIPGAGAMPDPYVWHDPAMLPWLVERVRRALSEVDDDPVHRTAWDTHSVAYLAQIALADAYVTRRLDRVPAVRRLLAVPNATFAYFDRRYGFASIGLLGDTVSYPTDALIDRFAGLLVERRPPVVFIDASVSPVALQSAVLRAAATVPVIPVAGQLYGVGLGQGNTYQGRYLGMIRRNADRIVAALA